MSKKKSSAKQKKKQKGNNNKYSAFVLLPFDKEFGDIYTNIIKPTLKNAGYKVTKADSTLDQQNILKDIIHGIFDCDLIVADLTTMRANVMYELGICHGLNKPTLMIAQSMDDVPFDLRSYRVIKYSTNYLEVNELKNKLTDIATKHKNGEISFGNPVSDFGQHDYHAEEKKKDDMWEGLDVNSEEKGMLDFIIDAEASAKTLVSIILKTNSLTGNITKKTDKFTADIKVLQDNKIPGTASKMHKLIKSFSLEMIRYAKELKKCSAETLKSWDILEENTSQIILNINTSNQNDIKALANYRDTMESTLSGTKEAKIATQSACVAVANYKGMSKDMNYASKVTVQSMEGVIQGYKVGESCLTRIINLIDERLNEH